MAYSSSDNRFQNNSKLFEAQQSALETASKLNALAFNYGVELNKTWFDLAQRHLNHLAHVPHMLAKCRTPDEVFSVQAEIIEKATNDYKKGLSQHAEVVSKATEDYKENLDQIATISQEMTSQARDAVEKTAEATRDLAKQGAAAGQNAADAVSGQNKSGKNHNNRPQEARQQDGAGH